MNLSLYDTNITTEIRKINYKDLIIFIIPVILFMYYLHVYNPGILSVDSYNQLHQIATGHFSNWHPFFHTFIEMICIKIYANPVSICILQILTFSIMWMVICKYNRNESKQIDKQFIIQVIITLAISLIPINAIYSITLWKDILFSYFLMFLCFLTYVLLNKKGNISYLFAIVFSAVMAVVAQIRPNGIFIILIMLIILGVYLFKNNKSQKLHIIIPALTIIFILLIASLNVAYNVEDNQKDAIFTKVAHMLADYDLNLQISSEDQAKIHEMMDEKTIKEKYEITYSDPIWGNANEQVYDNNKATYIGMAIKYSILNPLHFIEYILGSSPMVWDITRDDNWIGSVYKTDINNANRFYYSNNNTPASTFDGLMATNAGTDEYNQLNGFAYSIKDNLITDSLFDSPALYMYLAILLMIGIHFITKSKDIYFSYLPNLLNILIVLLSTPIQDNRYLYPNLLVFYLLVIILIGILFKPKSSTKPEIHQYDSTNENIYNDIESEIDNLTFEDIETILNENAEKKETPEEMESRIRAKILKEIEIEKQNKR